MHYELEDTKNYLFRVSDVLTNFALVGTDTGEHFLVVIITLFLHVDLHAYENGIKVSGSKFTKLLRAYS